MADRKLKTVYFPQNAETRSMAFGSFKLSFPAHRTSGKVRQPLSGPALTHPERITTFVELEAFFQSSHEELWQHSDEDSMKGVLFCQVFARLELFNSYLKIFQSAKYLLSGPKEYLNP